MRFAILANPVSGILTVKQKQTVLDKPSRILNAPILGLDTVSKSDWIQCARNLVRDIDVLTVAGGDGTFSDIINAIDTQKVSLAFLPLGSGNVLAYALNYCGTLADMAERIKYGRDHQFDLIACNKRRALMVSAGLEGAMMQQAGEYRAQGDVGLTAYLKAMVPGYIKESLRTRAQICIDGRWFDAKNLLNFRVVKQPFYGYGLKIMPVAKFDDGLLYVNWTTEGIGKTIAKTAMTWMLGTQMLPYYTGTQMTVQLETPLWSQFDGNPAEPSDRFEFKILPKALRIRC